MELLGVQSCGRSKVWGWGWRGEICGRRLVAQLLVERCWPPCACRSHALAQRLGYRTAWHPPSAHGHAPALPALLCRGSGKGEASPGREPGSPARIWQGFRSMLWERGEPVLGGVHVLRGGQL